MMKVRYTTHRRAAMVGQVEEVREDWGTRLVASGHAVAVDDSAPVAAPAPRQPRAAARAEKAAAVVPAPSAADNSAG